MSLGGLHGSLPGGGGGGGLHLGVRDLVCLELLDEEGGHLAQLAVGLVSQLLLDRLGQALEVETLPGISQSARGE